MIFSSEDVKPNGVSVKMSQSHSDRACMICYRIEYVALSGYARLKTFRHRDVMTFQEEKLHCRLSIDENIFSILNKVSIK